MADEKPTRTPPYFPKKTLNSTVAAFLDTGVPSKLDKTVLSTMSGSARSAFLVGLRYLGLVDDGNHTQPLLEKYVRAEGGERQAILKEILTNSYSFLKDKTLDLSRATGGQLSEAMGKEGATTSIREKAVSFFLKSAEDAGNPRLAAYPEAETLGIVCAQAQAEKRELGYPEPRRRRSWRR